MVNAYIDQVGIRLWTLSMPGTNRYPITICPRRSISNFFKSRVFFFSPVSFQRKVDLKGFNFPSSLGIDVYLVAFAFYRRRRQLSELTLAQICVG